MSASHSVGCRALPGVRALLSLGGDEAAAPPGAAADVFRSGAEGASGRLPRSAGAATVLALAGG
jgi:hypothetical protein